MSENKSPNDIELMYNQVHAVKVNQDTIKMLNETNSQYLQKIAVSFLQTGKEIIDGITDEKLSVINNLKMVPWKEKEFEAAYNNINYLKINYERLYFVTNKSITEIHFEDSLRVEKQYVLVADTDTEFVIELLFKSSRVRNIDQFIYGNKYRFNWSKATNKMTVRKLTEKD